VLGLEDEIIVLAGAELLGQGAAPDLVLQAFSSDAGPDLGPNESALGVPSRLPG